MSYSPVHKVRLVTAAALFDGHDAAINIMRRLLQSKGETSRRSILNNPSILILTFIPDWLRLLTSESIRLNFTYPTSTFHK